MKYITAPSDRSPENLAGSADSGILYGLTYVCATRPQVWCGTRPSASITCSAVKSAIHLPRASEGYSPSCNSEPAFRAESKNFRNTSRPRPKYITFSPRATIIRSARKTPSISSARMPSNT